MTVFYMVHESVSCSAFATGFLKVRTWMIHNRPPSNTAVMHDPRSRYSTTVAQHVEP